MNEAEFDKLSDLFYREAPWGFSLSIEEYDPNRYGSCNDADKVITLFGPLDFEYKRVEITVLHEVAHANVNDGRHSQKWVREFIRLLEKHKIDKTYFASIAALGPTLFK